MSIDRRYTGGYLPLREAMERLFEGSIIGPQFISQGGFPPADLFMTQDNVVIEMAIPGAKPDDINVSVTGDSVTISGEIAHERHTGQGQQAYIEELWRGKFQRTFTLPTRVDANKAAADVEHGVLTLTLPKSEATRPRRIQVKGTIAGSAQDKADVSNGNAASEKPGTVEVQGE
jgi:HSP20 family protein